MTIIIASAAIKLFVFKLIILQFLIDGETRLRWLHAPRIDRNLKLGYKYRIAQRETIELNNY